MMEWLLRRCSTAFRRLARRPIGDAPAIIEESSGSLLATVPNVRSGPSHSSTMVVFVNQTDVVIQAWWIDYDSREVPYEKILPGGRYRQQTYNGHPWIFKIAETGERLVVNRKLVLFPEESPESVALVVQPEVLVWHRNNHHRFPPEFKSFVRTILLSHQRASSRSNSLPAASPRQSFPRSPQNRRKDGLGQLLAELPADIILHIISFTAPTVLDIEPL